MRLAGVAPAGFGVQLGQPGPKCLSGVGILGRIRVMKMGSPEKGQGHCGGLTAGFVALGLQREGCVTTARMHQPQPSLVTLSKSLCPCLSFPACKAEIMKVTFLGKLRARRTKC